MGATTDIQWCDSTVNGTTGCDGCELWPGPCYAGPIHEGRLARAFPSLYGPRFTDVGLAPGRIAKAAALSDLRGKDRPAKPWLDGMPRVIFVGDMGDVFSKAVPFEYLGDDLIANVASPKGSRHVWMLLTKRPSRAVEFAGWLASRRIAWPENLWIGTSITSAKSATRAQILSCHPAPTKFLSLEPMRTAVELAVNLLRNFALVIYGGESRQRGHEPYPFDVQWAREGIAKCHAAGISPFIKQLGSRPYDSARRISIDGPDSHAVELNLDDGHGGDWDEWPSDLRVREMPVACTMPRSAGREASL